MSRDADRLKARGWREIGTMPHPAGASPIRYWDHPDHQPDLRGAFTTTEARLHQRQADREGCDCIRNPDSDPLVTEGRQP